MADGLNFILATQDPRSLSQDPAISTAYLSRKNLIKSSLLFVSNSAHMSFVMLFMPSNRDS